MTLPVHRRPFAVFLSHAHVDNMLVEKMYCWLQQVAGIDVWLDSRRMDGGSSIREGLTTGIEQCRGMLILATKEAVHKGWVSYEVDVAMDERARSRGDFRVIPIRVEGACVDSIARGLTWIDMPTGTFDLATAGAILRALFPSDRHKDPRTSRDVYVSASWRMDDNASAIAVCRRLQRVGFRLIGDSKDQEGFRSDRIRRIVESCGAFVSIIPFRAIKPGASQNEDPYTYFHAEIDLARNINLPILLVCDPRAQPSFSSLPIRAFNLEENSVVVTDEIENAIDRLADDWRPPCSPQHVFLGVDLEAPHAAMDHPVREMMERITGIQSKVGREIHNAPVDHAIMDELRRAHLVVADLTGSDDMHFNLDVCIEAGMARATGVSHELFVKGRQRRPPFMLGRPQLHSYTDELDLLGKVHRVVREYRRRVIDVELPAI